MSVGSVLIAGGGIAGCAVAIALARVGVDVALVERGPRWPGAGADTDDPREIALLAALGVTTPEPDHGDRATGIRLALQQSMTALAVEVRTGVELLGVIDVDSHIEAELSNGRVENFDAVVVADAEAAARLSGAVEAGSARVVAVAGAADALGVAERLTGAGISAD